MVVTLTHLESVFLIKPKPYGKSQKAYSLRWFETSTCLAVPSDLPSSLIQCSTNSCDSSCRMIAPLWRTIVRIVSRCVRVRPRWAF